MVMKPEEIKLLIAEDDEDFRNSICDLFSMFHFTVTGAQDGLEAWQLLQKNKYDIVIADMRMPRITGYELLKKIKERDPEFPKVILISGYSDVPISELFASGVDGFFAKPFDVNQVRKCITKALVSPSERWSKDFSYPNSYRIQRRFSDFDVAIENREILFGRLGFFVPLPAYNPKSGEVVKFDFVFGDRGIEMSGYGQVAFTIEKSKNNPISGVGIEIIHLNSASIARIYKILETHKPIASIPKP